MRHSLLVASLFFALATLILAPTPALAGACPMCTTAADCMTPGGFCVLWGTSPGCGTITQICCPGQGCNVGSDGRPSCEASGECTVVDGPLGGSDAGVTDASVDVSTDARTDVALGTDTGTGQDAAMVADVAMNDAPASDAGTTTRPAGCGCTTPGRNRGDHGLAALALAGVVLLARRRGTQRS